VHIGFETSITIENGYLNARNNTKDKEYNNECFLKT